MSLFRYQGSKVYTMDFLFHGQRIRESTGTRSKTLAKKIEDKRRQELEMGTAGIKKYQQPHLFSVAAEEWLKAKKTAWSPKMYLIQKTSIGHILPVLGKKLLVDIDSRDIAQYQETRIAESASPRTVNIEVSTLRQIMRKHGTWARIQTDVRMLPERQDAGRALTDREESALLLECGKSRSRILSPFVLLALETGARYNTIRTLQWSNIDFANRCLQFGKDKTPSGTGRIVPLNQRAIESLKFWAQQFPNRLPEHYVFPAEKAGAAGDSFDAKVYSTDPTNPIGDVKEAWEAAKRRTQRHCPACEGGKLEEKPEGEKGFVCESCKIELDELPAGLSGVRFHDLRHSAVSRMIAARVPLPIIAKIVGWSAGTMAKMAASYGHFGMEELRGAVEKISRIPAKNASFEAESPVNSPVSAQGVALKRAN